MPKLTDRHLECIIAALLAVNAYPLEKAQGLLPALKVQGLLSPEQVSGMSLERIISGLEQAGYSRGNLTWMFAERLKAVMDSAGSGGLDSLVAALASDDRAGGIRLLDAVRGIGPHVASTAWTLLRLL